MYISKFFLALAVAVALISSAFGWEQTHGLAYDVGDGWIIGTTVESGGYGIYRWNSTDWEKISGGAVRIGGTYSNPWIVNEQHIIYHWTGSDWQQMPGTAYDVGDGWIIGTKVKNGGYGIYRWNGSSWDQIRGSAISIGGAGGPPWIVNNAARIYRW